MRLWNSMAILISLSKLRSGTGAYRFIVSTQVAETEPLIGQLR